MKKKDQKDQIRLYNYFIIIFICIDFIIDYQKLSHI